LTNLGVSLLTKSAFSLSESLSQNVGRKAPPVAGVDGVIGVLGVELLGVTVLPPPC